MENKIQKLLDQNLEVLVLNQLYGMEWILEEELLSVTRNSIHLSNLSNNPEFVHPFFFSLPLQQSNLTIIASHSFHQGSHSGPNKNTNMANNEHQKPSLVCFFCP